MLKKCNYIPKSIKRNIYNFYQIYRALSSSQVTAALRPFYFLVHPDLFAQHPRAQKINDVNLKLLNGHLDSLINNMQTVPLRLQFYIKGSNEDGFGSLETMSLNVSTKSAKSAIQSILRTFKLPTNYVDLLEDKALSKPCSQSSHNEYYYETLYDQMESIKVSKKTDDLYSWLIKNMGEAEKRLAASEPIRKDIARLRTEIVDQVSLSGLSWERGIGTTHLRGCLQGLRALIADHPTVRTVLEGRHIYFGNETGVSMQGCIVLSKSEVRDQWLQLINRAENQDDKISRIPYMQKAVSNSLRNIQVTHRKYQPFVLGEAYSKHLKRLVTSLGDFMGKNGFPSHWPSSLAHLQLVVESASGPLMLSPTGQIIVPSSCPPWLLVNFISENMEEAFRRISCYESVRKEEKQLHHQCQETLSLAFLDKDDSVSPLLMVECLSRLITASDRLSPLLAGARLWITHYYSVMIDGEVCIPCDWNKSVEFTS